MILKEVIHNIIIKTQQRQNHILKTQLRINKGKFCPRGDELLNKCSFNDEGTSIEGISKKA